jgi:hypothetical protein
MAEFTKPLRLTTPPERTARVKDAQYLLTTNRHGQNYHPGVADGAWGAQSAGAARRAKYWLGYPTNGIDNKFGQQLYSYLLGMEHKGWAPLPTDYRNRREARIAAIRKTGKQEALNMALQDAIKGIHESPPDSNNNMYGQWYGLNYQPWCAMACTYWYVHAGVTGWARGSRWSYVPALVDVARYGAWHLALTRYPEPGDAVSYTTNEGPNEHIEMFENWVEQGSSFYAVGGNTSKIGSVDPNGGMVARNLRYTNWVTHFIRVGGT